MKRKNIIRLLLAGLLVTIPVLGALAGGNAESQAMAQATPVEPTTMAQAPAGMDTAVLAGGCFWGMEAVFESLIGVTDVKSGYSGGEASTAHYNIVSTGRTGHAESVEITYDPKIISFNTLLDVYFTVAHNPTELNYQGPDHGTQYRSEIFYVNDAQKQAAESAIKKLDASGEYKSPVVTKVEPLKAFYPAEEYHQDFMKKNPNYPYIVYWDVPKIDHLKTAFPQLVKAD